MHAEGLQHPCCGIGDLDAAWIRCAIPFDCQDSIQEDTFAVGFAVDDATLNDLRKVVPNIRQPIMWSYEIWSELDAQLVMFYWRMVRILPVTWNVDFALVDKRNKNRMREEIRGTWCSDFKIATR
jgi:hypothetical protein